MANLLVHSTYFKWFALLSYSSAVVAVFIPVQPVANKIPTFPVNSHKNTGVISMSPPLILMAWHYVENFGNSAEQSTL